MTTTPVESVGKAVVELVVFAVVYFRVLLLPLTLTEGVCPETRFPFASLRRTWSEAESALSALILRIGLGAVARKLL